MGELLGFDPALEYEKRASRLIDASIALWDVLASCIRPTSRDADIVESSIVPNDFSGFLNRHPHICHIFFNGSTAESTFKKHVLGSLDPRRQGIPRTRLPSTSPLNARLSFEEKLQKWRAVMAQPSGR